MSRWAVLELLSALSFSALAAREEAVFQVSVKVPTSDFYVLPLNPGFLEREQTLSWNPVTETLSALREPFDVKNVLGAVDAYLAYEPVLFNGRDNIALTVTFNQQVLGLDAMRVVPEAEARVGKRVLLEIAAQKPEDGYLPGQYFGNVQIIFDALRP